METSLACVLKAHNFSSSISLPGGDGQPSPIRANSYNGSFRAKQPRQRNKLRKGVNCAKGGPASALERKLGVERISEEELMGFGSSREKCQEKVNGGIAELLECLEREAIMGEDEGKEPTDYSRRAQIFEQSSRVFQAIKESTPTPTATS